MNKQYYIKVGKRYKPHNDPYAYDGLREGVYLVKVKPGSTSIRTLLNPEYAAFEAVADELIEELVDGLREASELRPIRTPLTNKEMKAWEAYEKVMGDEKPMYLGYQSLWDIAKSAVETIKGKFYAKKSS